MNDAAILIATLFVGVAALICAWLWSRDVIARRQAREQFEREASLEALRAQRVRVGELAS